MAAQAERWRRELRVSAVAVSAYALRAMFLQQVRRDIETRPHRRDRYAAWPLALAPPPPAPPPLRCTVGTSSLSARRIDSVTRMARPPEWEAFHSEWRFLQSCFC